MTMLVPTGMLAVELSLFQAVVDEPGLFDEATVAALQTAAREHTATREQTPIKNPAGHSRAGSKAAHGGSAARPNFNPDAPAFNPHGNSASPREASSREASPREANSAGPFGPSGFAAPPREANSPAGPASGSGSDSGSGSGGLSAAAQEAVLRAKAANPMETDAAKLSATLQLLQLLVESGRVLEGVSLLGKTMQERPDKLGVLHPMMQQLAQVAQVQAAADHAPPPPANAPPAGAPPAGAAAAAAPPVAGLRTVSGLSVAYAPPGGTSALESARELEQALALSKLSASISDTQSAQDAEDDQRNNPSPCPSTRPPTRNASGFNPAAAAFTPPSDTDFNPGALQLFQAAAAAKAAAEAEAQDLAAAVAESRAAAGLAAVPLESAEEFPALALGAAAESALTALPAAAAAGSAAGRSEGHAVRLQREMDERRLTTEAKLAAMRAAERDAEVARSRFAPVSGASDYLGYDAPPQDSNSEHAMGGMVSEWTEYWDEPGGHPYWVNEVTGETVVESPWQAYEEEGEEEIVMAPAAGYFNPAAPAFNPAAPAFNPGAAAFNPGAAAFNPAAPAFNPGAAAFAPSGSGAVAVSEALRKAGLSQEVALQCVAHGFGARDLAAVAQALKLSNHPIAAAAAGEDPEPPEALAFLDPHPTTSDLADFETAYAIFQKGSK